MVNNKKDDTFTQFIFFQKGARRRTSVSDCCQFINKEASRELINTTLAISVNIEYIAPAGSPCYLFTNSDAPTSWKQANMVVQHKNIKTDKHLAENPSLPFFYKLCCPNQLETSKGNNNVVLTNKQTNKQQCISIMSYDCPSWNKYTSCVKWTRVWAKSVKRLLGQVEKAKKVSSSGGWAPKLVLKWQIDAKTSASLPRQTHTCDSFTGIRNILCLPYSSHNTAMEVPPFQFA